MRIFLTGATGFIGSHVMQLLLARGDEVVALSRSGRGAAHLKESTSALLTVVRGDLLVPETYRDAVSGCDAVVHVAGWISTRRRDEEKLRVVNVTATQRLWDVCSEAGTGRIVYLASIFAHGRGQGRAPCDETAAFDPSILLLPVPYFRAKREAEVLTWQVANERGLPVVFGYPGFCIGPGDEYLSSMRIVRDFLRGRLPAYVEGGMSFVDVRDAAAGLVGCLDAGQVREKYLLTNHNVSWGAFFESLREVAGGARVPVAVPRGLAGWLGRLSERVVPGMGVSEGDTAVMGGTWFYDGSRARRELGMGSRPLERSLADGVSWLRERGQAG
jgi:dihydroflavonol-4-reductase